MGIVPVSTSESTKTLNYTEYWAEYSERYCLSSGARLVLDQGPQIFPMKVHIVNILDFIDKETKPNTFGTSLPNKRLNSSLHSLFGQDGSSHAVGMLYG